MSALLALAALLLTRQEPDPAPAPDPVAEVARVLVREAEPDSDQFARAEAELATRADAFEPLLAALGSGQAGDAEHTRLGARQLELVVGALERFGSARLTAFVNQVAREPDTDPRSVAALRILGARGRADDVPAALALARRAEEHGRFALLEVPFEDALTRILVRAPAGLARLRDQWGTLGPEAASLAVHAVESVPSREALACVGSFLGRRAELDACVLVALGNLAALAEDTRRAEVAGAIVRYLDSKERGEVLAAASALGRLAVADTVPDLIETLTLTDAACVRAALEALRAIGGVSLPASPQAWRAWYGREETWWQERAREALAELAHSDGSQDVGAACARLSEISEHPLHRDLMAPRLVPLLRNPEPRIRVLVCECFARLGSRTVLGPLRTALRDESGEVAAAARAALVSLGGEEALSLQP